MQVTLSPETEQRLADVAAREGVRPDDVARAAIERFLDEETRFAQAVHQGLDAAERGGFVSADDVWATVESVLKR